MVENEEETAFKSEMNKSFRIFENAQDLKKNFANPMNSFDSSFKKGAFDKLAFGANEELENCDLLRIRSSRRNIILLDDYLKEMRKVYLEATKREVDWYMPNFRLKIFGIPKTERARDNHVTPRLILVTQTLAGMSFASALRRHSYTFEEVYKTTIFTGAFGMVIYIAAAKYLYYDYFNKGEKYESNLSKECKVCWTLKAYSIWLSLSFYVPLSAVFWMAEPNNKYGGNLQMMNDIATKRHWQFWGQVFRDCFVKNGRPKVCATTVLYGITAVLIGHNVFNTIDDEELFRNKMIKYYTQNIAPHQKF